MNKIINKLKCSILFYVIMFVIIFVLLHFFLKLFNIQFRQWVYYFALLISTLGTLAGIIQLVRKRSKKVKLAFSIIGIIITIFVLIFWQIILLFFALSYSPEHIIEKNNNKYVAYVNSFLQVDVYYYDYINFFLVGNKVRIREDYGNGGYDPFDGKHDNYKPLTYYYYDENGQVINTNNQFYNKKSNYIENNSDNNNEEKVSQEIESNNTSVKSDDILYEKVIDNNTTIRVIFKDYILAQRSIIGIEKTTDGGKSWKEQLEIADGFMQIHNGAKFVFLDENIGFINDPGLAGTNGENGGLLVTTNGGKSFSDANIIHPNSIEEENLFISEVPYIENGILKVKIYTINKNKSPEKTYYEFYSEDSGVNWKVIE